MGNYGGCLGDASGTWVSVEAGVWPEPALDSKMGLWGLQGLCQNSVTHRGTLVRPMWSKTTLPPCCSYSRQP